MTDTELKQLLAKMLPEKINYLDKDADFAGLYYIPNDKEQAVTDWLNGILFEVLDTELLHVCWLVEEGLDRVQQVCYQSQLNHKGTVGDFSYHATWQQRTLALAKVKGLV